MDTEGENPKPATEQPEAPTPRPILFRTLTILWFFPSLGAVWILLHDAQWLQADGVISSVLAVRAEQWLAIVLLLLHGWFAWRWRRST